MENQDADMEELWLILPNFWILTGPTLK